MPTHWCHFDTNSPYDNDDNGCQVIFPTALPKVPSMRPSSSSPTTSPSKFWTSQQLQQLPQLAAQLAQVKKISPFEGVFSLGEDLEAVAAEPLQELLALLDGFCIEAKGPEVVQRLGLTAASVALVSDHVRSFQIITLKSFSDHFRYFGCFFWAILCSK